MKRPLVVIAAVVLLISAFVFLNNSTLLTASRNDRPKLLAHRGLAQTFSTTDLKSDTCTAVRINPPQHPYLENTLASMRAAFSFGADIVELDIHPTTDGHFAVFHDWTIDCRTNGTGVTREHGLAELQALDVGHGYTADGGRTFPFRGKGTGLMPSLDQVLAEFADRRLLIHIKSNDPREGELLAQRLSLLPSEQRGRLIVYGGERPVDAVRARMPDLVTMHGAGLKQCLLRYIALGWTGYVPASCHNSLVLVPINYAHWLWGWPHKFIARMQQASSEVYVMGPWRGGEFSTGIDDVQQLVQLPRGFSGGIWTNRIDRIAPALATLR